MIDKLAAKHLVQAIDEDLARLVWLSMTLHKSESINDKAKNILGKLLLRWNCVLEAEGTAVSDSYKQKTVLALAILLHKYGIAEKAITTQALSAIDKLNDAVVLSNDFFRKSEEIKKIISSSPTQLVRKPVIPESITFYRKKDVISIQLGKKFYGAYIHDDLGINESPIIEFYDAIFDKVPTIQELKKYKAKGEIFNDGVARVAKYSVSGLKFLPDPANQIKLIEACVNEAPLNNHLEKPVGLLSVQNIYTIQRIIMDIFSK